MEILGKVDQINGGCTHCKFLFEARDAGGILRGQKSIGAAGNKFLAFRFPMTPDLMISAYYSLASAPTTGDFSGSRH